MSIFELSPRAAELKRKLEAFVTEKCVPAEPIFRKQHAKQADRWQCPPIMEELKAEAQRLGLWNLFLPHEYPEGAGLTNLEYAPLCEIMGRCPLASEACNCSAPDTGNMEVLAKYGSPEQKQLWLRPLLDGKIRSSFLMTEPDVASSDATNIRTSIVRDGDEYIVTGRKWWSTGAMDPRCRVAIVMGLSRAAGPLHQRHSMIVVPMDAPGVRVVRPLTVFGYDDAPFGHAEVELAAVRVPAANMILGEGRGFEIAQGRLGPGRIHHCMRALGVGERALEELVRRAASRVAFGRELVRHAAVQRTVADCRMALDQARLLVLHAAHAIDAHGARDARKEIAMIKIATPRAVLGVLDAAIQVHGGAGVSGDTWLAQAWAFMRTLRIADGPDDVHYLTVARQELRAMAAKLEAEAGAGAKAGAGERSRL